MTVGDSSGVMRSASAVAPIPGRKRITRVLRHVLHRAHLNSELPSIGAVRPRVSLVISRHPEGPE